MFGEHDYSHEIARGLQTANPRPIVARVPTPGRYYRIQPGDTLLGVAGRAYSVSAGPVRLELARGINRHPLNRKLVRADKPTSLFPEGLIPFLPRYSCDDAALTTPERKPVQGSCFAVIWIPSRDKVTHPRLGPMVDVPRGYLAQLVGEAELSPISHELGSARTAPVTNHEAYPYRFICSLFSVFTHPTSEVDFVAGPATGTLIGFRHVLTAAHVLHSSIQLSETTLTLDATEVLVTPGDHSPVRGDPLATLATAAFGDYPIGRHLATKFRIHPTYLRTGHDLADYAVLRLNTAPAKRMFHGRPYGYWGSTEAGGGTIWTPQKIFKSGNRGVRAHEGKMAHIAGYSTLTVAKRGVRQMCGWGPIQSGQLPEQLAYRASAAADRALLAYSIDTVDGMSGSPVWRVFESGGRTVRALMAVHTGRAWAGLAHGVLLTSKVMQDIRRMKV